MHEVPRPFPALPGTTPLPRALFIDRWGTLLEPPERGYAEVPDEVRFYPGVLDALFRASRAGWRLYLVGNEEAVAFGKLPKARWEAVEEHAQAELRAAGVRIDRSYLCLDHPEGIPGHTKDSVYLLPNTGAFYHAAHNDGIQLRKSWVIGDSTAELVAGARSGLRLAGVHTGEAVQDGRFLVEPEFFEDDLARVVLQLLALEVAIHP